MLANGSIVKASRSHESARYTPFNMIHFKHKLVYIHIPKTGGTSIEMALTGFHDDRGTDDTLIDLRGLTTEEFHIPYLRSFCRHAPYSYYRTYIENVLGAEIGDYTVFTSIRNPWAQIVSSFHFWRERTPSQISHYSMFAKLRRCYIPALADKLFGSRIGLMAHMACTANQSLRNAIDLWLEDNEVDYILRCECLEDDFTSMCNDLNVTMPLQNYNKTKKVIYQEHYNWFSRRLVQWAHRKTIRRFGYRFD